MTHRAGDMMDCRRPAAARKDGPEPPRCSSAASLLRGGVHSSSPWRFYRHDSKGGQFQHAPSEAHRGTGRPCRWGRGRFLAAWARPGHSGVKGPDPRIRITHSKLDGPGSRPGGCPGPLVLYFKGLFTKTRPLGGFVSAWAKIALPDGHELGRTKPAPSGFVIHSTVGGRLVQGGIGC